MTTPHPHAEFFRAIADGDSLSNWECRSSLEDYRAATTERAAWILREPDEWIVRRIPTPKVIDWSKLGRHVPVNFYTGDAKRIGLLRAFQNHASNFFDGCFWWGSASLDTGLWVANHDGVNCWPDGVIVEVVCRSRALPSLPPRPAGSFVWSAYQVGEDIIASRFHSLEEGWSYE